jgi:hypothetical protein
MNAGNITLITAIIGATCGLLGAVLGIINTCQQLSNKKVRLKVLPQLAIPCGAISNAGINFMIEVINLSNFPVTISNVGLLLIDRRQIVLNAHGCYEQPGNLPLRLEPRTSYGIYFNIDQKTLLAQVKSAYVKTQCGKLITGTSGALKQKIRKAKA